LLINKHPSATLNASIKIPGLKKAQKARVYSYGIPQDEAARTGEGSADVQQTKLLISGSTLSYSPEPYSATVIDLELGKGN
jgi:alpha-L-arabinofuranosidase